MFKLFNIKVGLAGIVWYDGMKKTRASQNHKKKKNFNPNSLSYKQKQQTRIRGHDSNSTLIRR